MAAIPQSLSALLSLAGRTYNDPCCGVEQAAAVLCELTCLSRLCAQLVVSASRGSHWARKRAGHPSECLLRLFQGLILDRSCACVSIAHFDVPWSMGLSSAAFQCQQATAFRRCRTVPHSWLSSIHLRVAVCNNCMAADCLETGRSINVQNKFPMAHANKNARCCGGKMHGPSGMRFIRRENSTAASTAAPLCMTPGKIQHAHFFFSAFVSWKYVPACGCPSLQKQVLLPPGALKLTAPRWCSQYPNSSK